MKKCGKKLLMLALSATMILSFVGCGKKATCDGCGEEKRCKEYEITLFGMSEDMTLCKDCVDELEDEGINLDKK